MPLTFAHPAAVVPLLRRPFVPAALVAGAMSPDIPYFLASVGLPLSAQSWYEPFLNATTSHSPLGAITVSLPLGLVLLLGIVVAARPARAILPRRPPRPTRAWWVAASWALISMLIGIATHLVWDSFTHADGWVVENVAALQEPLIGSMTGGRVLQHLSTAAGLVIIAVVLVRHRRQLIPMPGSPERRRWTRVLVGGIAAAVIGGVAMTLARRDTTSLEYVLASLAIGAGVGVAVVGAIAVGVWWLRQWALRLVDRPGGD